MESRLSRASLESQQNVQLNRTARENVSSHFSSLRQVGCIDKSNRRQSFYYPCFFLSRTYVRIDATLKKKEKGIALLLTQGVIYDFSNESPKLFQKPAFPDAESTRKTGEKTASNFFQNIFICLFSSFGSKLIRVLKNVVPADLEQTIY